MATLSELMVKVGADIGGFAKGMQKVESNLKTVGSKMQSTGKKMTSVGKSLTTKVTAPLMAVGAGAVTMSAQYNSQMSKVQAVSGATGKDFDRLKETARQLGRETQFSAMEAGEGMEYLSRAGWDVDEIISGLPSVLNLAQAEAMDLGSASDIVSNIISGFGASADETGRYVDVLAKASSSSNTDVTQLGEGMKYVAPMAQSLGMSVEETASAIGVLSDAGIQGSQAGTVLRAGLTRLANPTSRAKGLMNELGMEIFDAEGNMKSFPEVIGEVGKATNDMTQEQKAQTVATLFGQEATSGFLKLLESGEDGLQEFTGELENAEGTAQDMADTMADNLQGKLKSLWSQISDLAISLGDSLTPMIEKAIGWVSNLADWFGNLSESTKMGVTIFGVLAGALPPIITVIGFMTQGIGFLIGAFAGISAPVLAVIGVLTALGASFVLLWNKSETFREGITTVFNGIKTVVQSVMEAVVTFIQEKLEVIKQFWDENGETILQAVETVWNAILAIFEFVMPAIQLVVEYVWNAIKGVISGALDIIMGLVKTFSSLLTGDFSGMWEGIKQLFSGAIEFVWNLMNLSFAGSIRKIIVSFVKGGVKRFKGLWDSAKGIFKAGKDKVSNIVTALREGVVKIFTKLKDLVVNIVKAWWDLVKQRFNTAKSVLTTITNAIKSVITKVWNAIKTSVTSVVNAIKSVITSVWNAIKSTISSVLNAIKSVVTSIWNGIKSTITSVVNGIKNTVSNIFNGIKNTVSSIFNGIKLTATSVWNGIKTAITNPIKSAKETVLGIIDGIKNAFSAMKIKIPKPKLPKVNISKGSKKIAGVAIPYPKFSIDWNAKGAIFNSASVLGGGQGVGEAGAEAVLPIQHKRYMRPFANAVADHMEDMQPTAQASIENKFNIDHIVVREEADIDRIAQKLYEKQKRTNRSRGI